MVHPLIFNSLEFWPVSCSLFNRLLAFISPSLHWLPRDVNAMAMTVWTTEVEARDLILTGVLPSKAGGEGGGYVI
jgi:hypothetical protein